MMKRFLVPLLLLLCWSALGQSSIQKNYFTTNDNPALTFTNGTLVSTNIYVSNMFATNVTFNYITNINEFRGRTVFTTNLFATNSFITYLTNNTFYTTNVTEQFVTNNLSYITNLYGPFITNNTLYSTNIFTTNLFATYVTNNTDYITNLYGPFITNTVLYTTNVFGPFITNFQLYSTDIFVTNLTANYITNVQAITTNLFVSNAFFTNLTVEFITNDFLFVTNFYNSNAFITNLTANYITNNTSYTTNLISSNIYTTNIFVMEASWFTNRWVGPTNDVSFNATYQNFVAAGDMEITGFQNSIATNANTSVLLLDPGGATRTLYFPATWTNFTSDGNNAYVIPKTNTAIVTLFQYGNLYTNVVVRLFGPGTGTPAPVAQVWSNYQGFIFPAGEPAPDTNGVLSGPDVYFGQYGGIFMGSNYSAIQGAPNVGTAYPLAVDYLADHGDPTNLSFLVELTDSASDNYDVIWSVIEGLRPNTPSIQMSFLALATNNHDSIDFTLLPNTVGNMVDIVHNGSHIVTIAQTGVETAAGYVDTSGPGDGSVAVSSSSPSKRIGYVTDVAFTDKNNAFTTASSNYVAMTVTTSTNQNQVTPDFSIPEQLMSTNAAFKFLAPVGVDATKTTVQWTLVNVTNTTAAAVLITSPDNCHTVGTAYVTNLTAVWFQCYAQKFTNAFYIPVF